MAERSFRSWIGFKGEDTEIAHVANQQEDTHVVTTPSKTSSDKGATSGAGSQQLLSGSATLERIRQLEAELADLRSRRDITSLTREEFEILATETAMTLIKTAQAREARAVTSAKNALNEAQRSAKSLTDAAESKAHSILQGAEGRGRKYLEAAEREAKEAIDKAKQSAQELLDSKSREATALLTNARRDAERAKAEAIADISNFKNWFAGALDESARLQKSHLAALTAAEDAIRLTKAKVNAAFEKLTALGVDIEAALDEGDRPKSSQFTRSANSSSPATSKAKPAAARPTANRATTVRKSTGTKTKRK